VDPNAAAVVAENSNVCAAPRGIAYDKNSNRLLVACAEGKLLFHSAKLDSYQVTSSVAVDTDARDVVPQGGRIFVSRFRSAEVLQLSSDGALVRKVKLPRVRTGQENREFEPAVAWRMRSTPDNDGVLVLHQRGLATTVGEVAEGEKTGQSQQASPYGGTPFNPCSSIVQAAISRVNPQGTVETSPGLDGAVLAVDFDVATSPRTGETFFTLATAGVKDEEMPLVTTRTVGEDRDGPSFGATDVGFSGAPNRAAFGSQGFLALVSVPNDSPADATTTAAPALDVGCVGAPTPVSGMGPTSSVLFDGDVQLVLQPTDGYLARDSFDGGGGFPAVTLAEPMAEDTGHAIFHRDSGGGIACASCHPEGTDDGRVWQFKGTGARRTQHLGVSIAETAPFHWDGSLPTLDSLMSEVFVERMGGVHESGERIDALTHWLTRKQHSAHLSVEPESAARGRELFESEAVGCARCHTGPVGTDNQAYDVGTSRGVKLQTPALAGLALHPPFMHDGCAQTLRQRFDAKCGGGDAHGQTSKLADGEVDDLVAYLQTL
jgi:hypothetical protein